MAVKKTSRVQLDEFVSEICPDPAKCESVVMLTGFVGRGEGEGRIRVYTDANLSHWYELAEADVAYSKPIENSSIGGSHLWLRSDAKLRPGAAQAAREFAAAQAVPRAAATGMFNPYLAGVPISDPSICIDPTTNCPPFTSKPICIDPVVARAGVPISDPSICISTKPPQCVDITDPSICIQPVARGWAGVPITHASICIDPTTNCPPFTSPPICINPVEAWLGAYNPRVSRAGSVPISDPSICIDTNPPGCVPITDPKICVDPVTAWRNYWAGR
jgi:hypothetical protein